MNRAELDRIISEFGELPELGLNLTPGEKQPPYTMVKDLDRGFIGFRLGTRQIEYFLMKQDSKNILARRVRSFLPEQISKKPIVSNVRATFIEDGLKVIEYVQRFFTYETKDGIAPVPANPTIELDMDNNAVQNLGTSKFPIARAEFRVDNAQDTNRVPVSAPAIIEKLSVIIGRLDKSTTFGHQPGYISGSMSGITFVIDENLGIEGYSINLQNMPTIKPVGSLFALGEILPSYGYETAREDNTFRLISTNLRNKASWEVCVPSRFDVLGFSDLISKDGIEWRNLPQQYPAHLK